MSDVKEELAEAGVRLEITDQVARVTLDRPEKRNAQTPAMWSALAALGRSLPGDVRVVVLRGNGAGFSAGLDLAMFTPEGLPGARSFVEMAALPDAEADAVVAGYQEAFTWWSRPDIVSIAGVQGHAIGAGFQLALGCDFRVAADNALFTMAETSRGIVPDLSGTGRLVDLVGTTRALDICVTGRRVDAAEAMRIGLVDRVCALDDLDAAVEELVATVLAPLRDAVVETKALITGARGRSTAERLAAERAAQMRRLRDLAGVGE